MRNLIVMGLLACAPGFANAQFPADIQPGTVRTQCRHFDASAQDRSFAGRSILRQPGKMSGSQLRRNDQVNQFSTYYALTRVTEKTFGCNVPFPDTAVIANDDDAIERRIEDGLAILLADSEVLLLFARELLHRFENKLVNELVDDSFGGGSR